MRFRPARRWNPRSSSRADLPLPWESGNPEDPSLRSARQALWSSCLIAVATAVLGTTVLAAFPDHAFYLLEQVPRLHRFGEVVVTPRIDDPFAVRIERMRGHCQNRNARSVRIRADAARCFETIHHRK